MAARWIAFGSVVLLAACGGGGAGKKDSTSAASAASTASADGSGKSPVVLIHSELHIESSGCTNSGNVLHMLVRQLDAKALGTAESYEEAVAHVVAPVRDETVVAVRPVLPGIPLTVELESAQKKRLVAYFFFTRPGLNWRVELPMPPPDEMKIALGENEVTRLEIVR
jgi:hypothetical protein